VKKTIEYYLSLRASTLEMISHTKGHLNRWVGFRLLTFLIFGGGIFALIKTGMGLFWLAVGGGIAGFLWSVKQHKKYQESLRFARACEANVNRELAGLQSDWHPIISSPQAKATHAYAHDLDIIGPASLYDQINRCRTLSGQDQLVNALLNVPHEESFISTNQELAREVSLMHEWRIRTGAAGDLLIEGEHDAERVGHWATAVSGLFSSPLYSLGLILVPLWFVANSLLVYFDVLSLTLGGILMLLPLIPVGINIKKSTQLNTDLGYHHGLFSGYLLLIKEILAAEKVSDTLRKELQPLEEAVHELHKLGKVLDRFDQRNNLLVAFITNAMYWSEIRNVRALDAWKRKNGLKVSMWLNQVGRLEFISCLGTRTAHMPAEYAWPKWDNAATFDAVELKHALMPEAESVANSVELPFATTIRIITGANMAGKSTYLRTVGVGYVMAHIGAPIRAKEVRFSGARLITSMRTTDSLQDGTSYFLAELKRLSMIIEELKDRKPTLLLLDEILKGTNSNDKAEGSKAFVRQLTRNQVSVLVATHDLTLCELQKEYPGIIHNQHFAAKISNDDLSFDYKIRPDVCDTMNATFLMRKLGIISAED
jgi:hypothetical protein